MADGDFEGELNKIMKTLSSGRTQKIDLVEFMQDCTDFFEKAGSALRMGNAREKEIAVRKFKELAGMVEKDIQSVSRESGKTEEEMAGYIENPDNFSSETWSAIQRANKKILSDRRRKKIM